MQRRTGAGSDCPRESRRNQRADATKTSTRPLPLPQRKTLLTGRGRTGIPTGFRGRGKAALCPQVLVPRLITAPLSRSQRRAESNLAEKLTEQLAQIGYAVQIGIARGTLAASLAAREQLLIADPGVMPFLSAQPLSSLGFFLRPGIKISGFDFSDQYLTKMTDSLTHLGITSLGQLCALGRPALIRRSARWGRLVTT
mgnify:CR=1 FL=1